MKAQRTVGPFAAQSKGGGGVGHGGNLAKGVVCRTLWEMKMQLMDLQETVNSLIRSVENGRGTGLGLGLGLGGPGETKGEVNQGAETKEKKKMETVLKSP